MGRRIDAHCHIWQLSRGDYGWLTGEGGPLAPIRRDFSPGDLAAERPGAGIAASILVQAAPSVDETRFMLEAARHDDGIAGVVGWVDLSKASSVETLEALAADPHFKGVRPMLQDLPDLDWIATQPHSDAVKALHRLGLRFDALVTPVQLPALCRFADRYPDLPLIIDHAAKPAFAAPESDPRHAQWRDGMRALSERPGTICKLSGLLTELPPERRSTVETATEALAPVFYDLIEWFGPERLAWGSDWPVVTLAAPFGFWNEVTDRLLAELGERERQAIRGDTAVHFYGLDEGEAA